MSYGSTRLFACRQAAGIFLANVYCIVRAEIDIDYLSLRRQVNEGQSTRQVEVEAPQAHRVFEVRRQALSLSQRHAQPQPPYFIISRTTVV